MSYCSMFCLFLYKQVLLLQYNWKSMSFLLTVCLALQNLLLYAEHNAVEPLTAKHSSNDLITLHSGCFFDIHHTSLQSTFYAPNTTFVNKFMKEICGEDVYKQGLSTLPLMLARIEICSEYCDGIFFNTSLDTKTSFQYTIYTNRMKLLTNQKYVTDSLHPSFSQSQSYLNFLKLQHSMDMEYILQNTEEPPHASVQIGLMPIIKGGYLYNEPAQLFSSIFPIFIIFIIIITFVVPMVEEKQNGLKEFLAVSTQLPHLNGITYFIIRLILYLIYMGLLLTMVSTFEANGIIPIAYVAVLMLLCIVSLMSYSQLISVAFNSVFYAIFGGFLMHYAVLALTWIPNNFTFVLIFIFSISAFKEAWDVMQILSNKNATFDFSQLFTRVTDIHFTIWEIYCILILQSIVYLLLYNYLMNIYPGPGRKPYLFFLQTKFWQSLWNDANITKMAPAVLTNENNTIIAILENVFKQFRKSGRRVVIANQLCMTVKNRQITVLLGHNGAGKTTILNMIMGFEAKDKGKIFVGAEGNAKMYRRVIGYCPQNNVYMPYMTCKGHLKFFAKLRGLPQKESISNSNHLLKELNLLEKADDYPKNLSGGMKRRLSLGIAIAGETKVIILDEPSSGLDVEARRDLWNLLLQLRKRRALLVTTHHMEEAEVLGDTICILSNGRIQYSGSSLALKRQFGNGYLLKLSTSTDLFKRNECLELIQRHIPSAKNLNTMPSSTLIALPYEYRDVYSEMLTELEKYQCDLGIVGISISDSTLDDVFLNSVQTMEDDTNNMTTATIMHSKRDLLNVRQSRNDSYLIVRKWLQQFLAIVYKKCIFLKNNCWFTFLLILIPFIMSTIAIITIQLSTVYTFGSAVNLKLDHYEKGVIYINTPSSANTSNQIAIFKNLLKNQILLYNGLHVKHLILNGSNNIEDELLKIMQSDLHEFQQNTIGCLQISENDYQAIITIFYSQNLIHSPAILTNLVDTAICMSMVNSIQCKLNTMYAPVTIYAASVGALELSYYAVLLPIGMFLLIFHFAKLPFVEFSTGFKTLQIANIWIHWFGVLFCDLTLLLLICVLLWAYQLMIMPQILYGFEDLKHIICALYGYSLTYLPLIYCLTNIFSTIAGLCAALTSLFVISIIPSFLTSSSIGDMLKYEKSIKFLRLLPDFNLIQQLRIINERFVNNNFQNISTILRTQLNNNRILNLNTFYAYVIIVFLLLMLTLFTFVENRRFRKQLQSFFKFTKFKSKSQQCPTPDNVHDRAVQHERVVVDQIKESDICDYSLIVKNLYKYYDGPVAAVCGISFRVQKGHCFGLLGINGAGKTSTFEMLAGNESISMGSIHIDGVNYSQDDQQYRSRFGYCPQTDRLNEFMTAYQILKFMALLRNIDQDYLHHEIMYWLKKFDILPYQHTQIKHYSGGTKRKLQAAVAMIGTPSLVLLDEPTTGVDPISRRILWQTLQDYLKCNKTIVLSSHSLDECEYLCNRLAIMAQGQFKCLGHIRELRKRYGGGFTINLSLVDNKCHGPNDVVDTITHYLQTKFSECILRENHAGILTFFIENQNQIPWSAVFQTCEELLNEFLELILEYSLNEITLEDIFLICNSMQSVS